MTVARTILQASRKLTNQTRLAANVPHAPHHAQGATLAVLDPRILYEPSLLHKVNDDQAEMGCKSHVQLHVPLALLDSLQKPSMELSELDTPGNIWTFGQGGELFDFQLVGRHTVLSGYTCIVAGMVIQQLQTGSFAVETDLRSFDEFKAYVNSDAPAWPKPPFLWAGDILESYASNVYQRLDTDGKTVNSIRVESHIEQTD